MFEEALVNQNPHWQGKLFPSSSPRRRFAKLLQYLAHPHTIAITGARRSGKSTLLKQMINHLIEAEKVNPKNILFLNLEHPYFAQYTNNVEFLEKLWEDYLKMATPTGKIYCFLDEVQYFDAWQVFVKAHYEEKNVKFFITGSNSALLSSEMMTLLTGRVLPLKIFPFSFYELAHAKGLPIENAVDIRGHTPQLRSLLDDYLRFGGFPDVALAPTQEGLFDILNTYTKTMLYQDVFPRLGTKKSVELERLFFYLISNLGARFSYASLARNFQLSDKTIKDFIAELIGAHLVYEVDKFSFSVKKQTTSSKKVYSVDCGQVNAAAFRFSENRGRLLENMVCLELMRQNGEVYYYHCQNNWEVDFLVKDQFDMRLVQVSESLQHPKTRERETRSLIKAMSELNLNSGIIVTLDEEETIKEKDREIKVIPAYKFLLRLPD